MSGRSGPWVGAAALLVSLGLALGAGGVLGVGPLAASPRPDQVTDPDEMIARSLQATLDADSVHLEGALAGRIPGALVDRPEASVVLDGSTLEGDLRPGDARTRARLDSPGLGLSLETVTVWDAAWFRQAPDAPWTRASLGGVSAEAGIDINPLTLVDRLRGYLAQPGLDPQVRDVPCAGTSGRCREITLDAGPDPAQVLAALLPEAHRAQLPRLSTSLVLLADRLTLRPVELALDATSEDGRVRLHLDLRADRWDDPSIEIEEPEPEAAG